MHVARKDIRRKAEQWNRKAYTLSLPFWRRQAYRVQTNPKKSLVAAVLLGLFLYKGYHKRRETVMEGSTSS